jgi:ABC-type glycerol-3-phosphate transport system substrate-binding protein
VPSAYGAGVDFSAGIAAVSNDATGAEDFISYLTDPKNAALWRKGGLEPLNH